MRALLATTAGAPFLSGTRPWIRVISAGMRPAPPPPASTFETSAARTVTLVAAPRASTRPCRSHRRAARRAACRLGWPVTRRRPGRATLAVDFIIFAARRRPLRGPARSSRSSWPDGVISARSVPLAQVGGRHFTRRPGSYRVLAAAVSTASAEVITLASASSAWRARHSPMGRTAVRTPLVRPMGVFSPALFTAMSTAPSRRASRSRTSSRW